MEAGGAEGAGQAHSHFPCGGKHENIICYLQLCKSKDAHLFPAHFAGAEFDGPRGAGR